jgi:hypothetical protein
MNELDCITLPKRDGFVTLAMVADVIARCDMGSGSERGEGDEAV